MLVLLNHKAMMNSFENNKKKLNVELIENL